VRGVRAVVGQSSSGEVEGAQEMSASSVGRRGTPVGNGDDRAAARDGVRQVRQHVALSDPDTMPEQDHRIRRAGVGTVDVEELTDAVVDGAAGDRRCCHVLLEPHRTDASPGGSLDG
jgi:hypothetical protein